MYPVNWPLSALVAAVGVPLVIKVAVKYDVDAAVYVATSSSVRGLVVEAPTLDQVQSEVAATLPELLAINHPKLGSKYYPRHTRLQFDADLVAA